MSLRSLFAINPAWIIESELEQVQGMRLREYSLRGARHSHTYPFPVPP
jgi:hypothetical protein